MFYEVSQRVSRHSLLKVGMRVAIIVIALTSFFYFFIYSFYLKGLSSSEEKLYQILKTTGDMQSLQGIEAESVVKLFLHSIEKEDWTVSSLFCDVNGDGTINTAFGPEKVTPNLLKSYYKMFEEAKTSSVQENEDDANKAYISLKFPIFVGLKLDEGVWYIEGVYTQ